MEEIFEPSGFGAGGIRDNFSTGGNLFMEEIIGLLKVSICIPAYNQSKVIAETLDSCFKQNYSNKEIIVCDDCSTDLTVDIVKIQLRKYPVRLYQSVKNNGIAHNLNRCIRKSTGDVVVFLCGDDIFTNRDVIQDIVDIFNYNPKVGYVSRFYYQFMNGYSGAVRVHRSTDPYFQADNPSGLAFRKEALDGVKSKARIFVEASSIVKQVLDKGWEYQIMKYDTIAVRIHPGGNTATVKSYYQDSPTLSWYNLIGPNKNFLTAYISFIQLKNWAPSKILFREIWLFIKLRPVNLFRSDFWVFTFIAIFTPRCILRPFTNFYKNNLSRNFVKIIEREENV